MSRIGKKIIEIPDKVKVEITENKIIVKGPKGELKEKIHPYIKVEESNKQLIIKPKLSDERKTKALWGLYRSLIFNMIKGVTEGFEKKLEINGVGYKVALEKKNLKFNVGYSHPVDFLLPPEVEGKVEKNVITLSSINKQLLGQVAANIRKIKEPEPYKGKGIKYLEEVIRRKSGKTAKGGEK